MANTDARPDAGKGSAAPAWECPARKRWLNGVLGSVPRTTRFFVVNAVPGSRIVGHRRPAWPAAIALAFLLLAPIAAAGGDDSSNEERSPDWGRYRDRELGMTFDFPAHIFSLESAEQGRSGVTFSTPDGRARIRVFAIFNEAHDTPARYLSRSMKAEGGRFTYVRTTPRFFVASGIRGGMIFYSRCNFSVSADRRVSCFQLDYPEREKRAWDSTVTRISLSLRATAE
jgi:hypothetical protein